jgi:hypothetical protein
MNELGGICVMITRKEHDEATDAITSELVSLGEDELWAKVGDGVKG